ncbi:hypothetical protein F7Q99_38405 [Streptomyces kaniharaensis]|uniref:DUF6292 domain-containing protein n=1 Tax=Streptomyces kaniharaensis TaxID=212423 RepID=A0A6N7L5B5_9ACTN|nr:DUF6292 family protein [Streptomyces kaniharaensis]MQS17908.1 hypothetical protein [Streptomyces kaniharaensis]
MDHAVDEVEEQSLQRTLGYYAAAVAQALIRDEVSVEIAEVEGHRFTEDEDPDDETSLIEVFEEAKAVLYLGREFARRVGCQQQPALGWDGQSGWYYFVDSDDTLPSESVVGARWLSDGLVPAPARVVAFVSALLLDSSTAGSGERPFYREAGQNVAELINRLSPHLPDHIGRGSRPWLSHLAHSRDWFYLNRALNQLSADDETVQVPMRMGELRTVMDLLKLHEMSATGPLGGLSQQLGRDLERRVFSGAVPPQSEIARESAARFKSQLQDMEARRRQREQQQGKDN